MSDSVTDLKINIEKFRKESVDQSCNNFWEVSNVILDKIEGNPNYLSHKEKFNACLLENPFEARRKGINIL